MAVKAIVLAGGESLRPYLLSGLLPKPLLPFLGRPLFESQIRSLRESGLHDIGVVVPARDENTLRSQFGNGSAYGVRLTWRADTVPSGPAGCLRLFASEAADDNFIVIEASTLPGAMDFAELMRCHARRGALATLAMYRDAPAPERFENVIFSDEECIERFEILHPSRDKRSHRRFAGVYVFSRRVLELIPPAGHVDIKEQLIPDLRRSGLVLAHAVQGYHATIDTAASYFRAQQECLNLELFDTSAYRREAHDTWLGPGVKLADSAHLVGPVIIGEGCVIGDRACVVGPAVLGRGTVVEPRALVRESILWDDCRVLSGARVEYCVLGTGQEVRSGETLREAIVMPDAPAAVMDDHRPRKRLERVRRSPVIPRLSELLSRAAKRALDVSASAVALILLAPVFALVAVAIRLDSPGPVFFIQRRCGRGGREFPMVKFRTMVPNAEHLQKQLQAAKSVDGPMFKIFEDPRLTRVGAFLRRNSIDELPQLWNVLMGHMSLVGPRPLVMSEMRFSPGWRDIRLSVRPGITGIWQVNGRSQTSFHDWIRHDVAYVRSWSLWLDLRILMKTAVWVLARTGAC